MRRIKRLPLALALMAVLGACGGPDNTTPTAPPPTPPPPVPPPGPPTGGPGSGTITIRELSPGLGAKLAVQNPCPTGSATRMCIDQWRGTFDVVIDREMTNAILNVRFFDGETLCGYGTTGMDTLPADTLVSLTVNRIVLSDDSGTFAQPCPLPAGTNRIEVILWSDHGNWTNTLIQAFEGSYTFLPPLSLTRSETSRVPRGTSTRQAPPRASDGSRSGVTRNAHPGSRRPTADPPPLVRPHPDRSG